MQQSIKRLNNVLRINPSSKATNISELRQTISEAKTFLAENKKYLEMMAPPKQNRVRPQ